MYFVYVLFSHKDNEMYFGFTRDIEQRVKRHLSGEVLSTKNRRPLELIFFEAYRDIDDALRREKYFKTHKGKTTIKTMLKGFLYKSDKTLLVGAVQ